VTFHIIENAEERMVNIDLLTGMFVSELSQIEIYPNPVIDILLISGLSGPAFVRIYNIHGQLLLTAHTEGNRGEIDLSNLPGGIYMIMFEMGKETVIRKFLKR
ncbi:MAG: T9SS type A sorting domain-containing protein, partial [Bacteroidales bacterium]|nr:T9SS type A sorting domain-containing protein [Bacteroidales bacterium]